MDFSVEDFDQFKCSECNKYLSVSPIFVYTDNSAGKDKNICGRCNIPSGGTAIRNVSFEALAKYLKFPCSVSKICKEKLPWGEADKHEKKCRFREMKCNICSTSYTITSAVTHFKESHPQELFFNEKLTLSEGDVHNHTYPPTSLVVSQKIICLVYIRVVNLGTDKHLYIKVESLFASSIPFSFALTFKGRNTQVLFKNKRIETCEDDPTNWKEYLFELNSILDIFVLEVSEFKIEFEINEDEKKNNQQTDSGPSKDHVAQESLAVIDELSLALECPTCLNVMKSNISMCEAGHSICEDCEIQLTNCPTCRSQFIEARNFALEEIARKFKDYL